jgi:hypothetical protein
MTRPSDRERLDWLTRKGSSLLLFGALDSNHCWDFAEGFDVDGFKTPRAAIDAAMKAERVKPGRRTGKGRK